MKNSQSLGAHSMSTAFCAVLFCTSTALGMQLAEQKNTRSEHYNHGITRALALHLAFIQEETEENLADTKGLLNSNADPNGLMNTTFGDLFLCAIARKNHTKIAQTLIERNADVNGRNTYNHTTPLMNAAAYSANRDMIQLLINNNANPTLYGMPSLTALHWAAQRQQIEAIQCLVDNDGNVYDKGQHDKAPFYFLSRENKKIIKEYCEQKAEQQKTHPGMRAKHSQK